MSRITLTELVERNPWEIAAKHGIAYTGDANTLQHGGAYYNTHNWREYGYADCVRFDECDGRLFVECGTVNLPSQDGLRSALESAGIEPHNTNEYAEIESVLGYWGMEVAEDFGGRYVKEYDADWADENEETVWKDVADWIEGLVV